MHVAHHPVREVSQSVHRLEPFYWLRLLGGTLYFVGALMAVYNLFKTMRGPESVSTDATAPVPAT